jgi:hypothetical protein
MASLTTTNVSLGVIAIVGVLEAALEIVLLTGGFMLFRRLVERWSIVSTSSTWCLPSPASTLFSTTSSRARLP